MKVRSFILSGCILFSKMLLAQWEVAVGPGVSIPITGYAEVVKTGWLINGEGRYRFKPNFAIGMKAQFVRLQNDKNPADQFEDARMTLAPLIFTAEYTLIKKKFQAYVTGGLGITFFNINQYISNNRRGIEQCKFLHDAFSRRKICRIRSYLPIY